MVSQDLHHRTNGLLRLHRAMCHRRHHHRYHRRRRYPSLRHEGIGGADGSILLEIEYPENRGLELPLEQLRLIKAEVANQGLELSWADVVRGFA